MSDSIRDGDTRDHVVVRMNGFLRDNWPADLTALGIYPGVLIAFGWDVQQQVGNVDVWMGDIAREASDMVANLLERLAANVRARRGKTFGGGG